MRKTIVFQFLMFFSVCLYAQTAKIDSLKLFLQTARDTSKVNVLCSLFKEYHYIDMKQGFDYALQAKDLAEKLHYTHGLAQAYTAIGTYYSATGVEDLAIKNYNLALKAAEPNDNPIRISVYHNLAFHQKTEREKLAYLLKSLKIAEKINFKRIGNVYNGIAVVYHDLNNYSLAFEYYHKGVKASLEHNDTVSYLFNLSGVSQVLDGENYENIFPMESQLLQMARKINNKWIEAMITCHICTTYRKKGKLDSALYIGFKALELAKEAGQACTISNSLYELGYIYELKNEKKKALSFFLETLSVTGNVQENRMPIVTLTRIGAIYNSLGKSKEAVEYLTKAIRAAKLSQTKDHLASAYQELSEAYYNSGDINKAYQYYKLFHTTRDSVYSMEKSKQIASLNAKYEVEKKEKTIQLLEQNNRIQHLEISQSQIRFALAAAFCLFILSLTILLYNRYRIKVKAHKLLEEANSKITSHIKEKDVLIQEIHHRVKNNLQLISSLLNWQAETIKDEQMLKILGEGRSRIKSMAMIHESLYKEQNFNNLNIKEYLKNLLGYLDKTYNPNRTISIIQNIEPVLLDVDLVIPIGLIVTELVSNSFKYAFEFPQEGNLDVVLWEEESNLFYLKVKDSGRGLPEEVIFNKSAGSMGLELVRTLAKQIKGKLIIYNEGGANFLISFSNINYRKDSSKICEEVSQSMKS